jgi:hypothetical protein
MLWPGKDGKLASLSAEDQQMLADRLYQAVHDAVSKQIKVVTSPGPGVIRLLAALTEASSKNVVLNVVCRCVSPKNTRFGKSCSGYGE